MPIYEFQCSACGHLFDEIRTYDPDEKIISCPHGCGMTAEKMPSLIGGYQGNTGPGSTRPKKAGSMRSKKLNFSGQK